MLKNKEKNKLEKIASFYDPKKERIESIYINYLSDTVIPEVKGPKVLEMGCSSGLMTGRLAKKVKDLTVIDGSKRYIDYVKRTIGKKGIKFIVSLFEDFETKEKFDDIIISHVLEHVENPVLILKKAKGWLKDSGRIHIAVPNSDSIHRMIGVETGSIKKLNEISQNDIKLGHRRVYGRVSLEKDVRSAGLKLVSLEGVFLKPLWASAINNWDKKVLDAFFMVGKKFPENCSSIYLICKK